ncbi:hypothetical protein BAY61_06380 [Prauserella marina]|nr:hypothetical protein BAY61_06380 [Prauserella marina]
MPDDRSPDSAQSDGDRGRLIAVATEGRLDDGGNRCGGATTRCHVRTSMSAVKPAAPADRSHADHGRPAVPLKWTVDRGHVGGDMTAVTVTAVTCRP